MKYKNKNQAVPEHHYSLEDCSVDIEKETKLENDFLYIFSGGSISSIDFGFNKYYSNK